MENQESRGASLLPDTKKIDAVIYTMTVLIKLGKYLPLIELALGIVNSIYAYLNFFVFNSYVSGTLNVLFAIGSFVFYAQLLPRRNVHRYQYHYSGKHQNSTRVTDGTITSRGEEQRKNNSQANGTAEA